MLRTPLTALAMAVAFAAAPAFGSGKHAPRGALDLPAAIEIVTQAYPGRVIAAQVDPSGGDSRHFHVDVLLPNGKVAKLDVDARSRRIASRLPPDDSAPDTLSLAEAVKIAQKTSRGHVVSAEYDPDPKPHYHMNVSLPGGVIARYDLDIATGKLEPRRARS